MTAAFLTGKASFKAAEIIREMESQSYDDGHTDPPLTAKERVQLVWPEYIPAAGTLVLSVGCIVSAHRVSSRRAAAIAAAYSISERAFVEYREKVVERIGQRKEREVRDDILQDRLKEQPVSKEVVILGGGDVLCYDAYSGRYFTSNMENIKKAQNDFNYSIINDGFASLTEFYDKLGLPKTSHSDDVGWNTDRMVDLAITTALSDDGRPCLSIDFGRYPPTPKFYKF